MPETSFPAGSLLAALPGFNGLHFDPLAYLTTVNYFHSLGFEGSLQVLRSFGKAPDGRTQENVLLVARALYLPNIEESLPRLDLGMPDVSKPEDPRLFPLFPLHIHRDLPLLLVGGYLSGGEGQPPSVYLDWCAEHGRMRPRSLRPRHNPLAGVDEFIASAAWSGLNPDPWQSGMLRRQALRAVAKLFPMREADEQALLSDEQGIPLWVERLKQEHASGITWNQADGAFNFSI